MLDLHFSVLLCSGFCEFSVVFRSKVSAFGVAFAVSEFYLSFRQVSLFVSSLFPATLHFQVTFQLLFFLILFLVLAMSDQSDSQNAFDEVFVTESDPSSPSVDPISEPDSSPVGRTRLLADIPPTIDREKELRSKFLNDPSTPEEHNLTLKYLTARQSGDKQTLRELRHQILARRSRRHPPADAVPGLDVPPLREHAWLDSLADAGVRVSSDFFDRLQECVAPNPPIIDLGDDNNSSTSTMAQDDHDEAVYHRRTDNASSKAPVTEENPPSDQEDEPDVGPGSGALWLPEDATNGPLTVEIDGLWRQDALDLSYPRTARDLYNMPSRYRLVVPSEGSVITECPPGHVAVYTHHLEFGFVFLWTLSWWRF